MDRKIFNLDYVISILLVYIGGFIELYSMVTRGIFAGMQTGNLIYTFTNLTDEKYYVSLKYLIVFLSFVMALILGELLRLHFKNKKYFYMLIVILEMLCLIPLFFLPYQNDLNSFDGNAVLSIVGDCFLSLYSGMHLIAFHEVNGHSFTPTMMTKMTKLFVTSSISAIKEKDKEKLTLSLSYLIQIACFILGSLTFYLCYKFIPDGNKQIFINASPALIMVIDILLLYLFWRREQRKEMDSIS